ncbi:MAG: hypothetical protein GY778_21760 [bacterium]|nr:hypothetical protein [bacterium]
MIIPLLALSGGCHTFEVHQFDNAQMDRGVKLDRAAVMMATYRTLEGDQTRQPNKLFTEQLIVSLQQRGIDVAERQKVEALLVDSEMVESGEADLTEMERAKRLGRLLKVDVLVYGDAIINETNYTYFSKLFFNNNAERWQLQKEANESGVVKQKGYPVLAQHSIGLSIRAVDTATGEIVSVGYHSLASARWAKEDDPQTLTNFSVIRDVCDAMMDDLVAQRR